ncbi:hypothetical protein ACLQ2R_21330 [Streptosporangium sp. DT93]|uniref:hypothetical protein n=1 Tax=Streptosporangium sp. DT93 TaxID=3393428 RepID=UPI003CF2CEE6
MSLSAVAPGHADHTAPRRIRRLILTILGPVFLLVLPLAVVRLYGDDLPGHVFFVGWPVDPRYELTWRGVSSQPAFGVMMWLEVLLVVPFVYYWRLPRIQRGLVALGFAVGLAFPVSGVLSVLAPASGSGARPAWHLAVEIVVFAGAFALGRVAAGPLPQPPEVTAAPPPHAPAMALGPRQRVLFTTSTWSVRTLLVAAALSVFTVSVVLWDDLEWWREASLTGMTLFVAAQARTRLQIDGSGVTLRVPWMPVLSRTVSYALIRFAEAGNEPPPRRHGRPPEVGAEKAGGPPPGRYGLGDSPEGWGAVSGKGPVLALSLADDRWFVCSTREARDAAALVNGELSRRRQVETAQC